MHNKQNKELKHLELFAGIGGFRLALELLGKDFGIDMNCIGYSEIDNYATQSYKANFDTDNDVEIGDIVSFTEDKTKVPEDYKNYLQSGIIWGAGIKIKIVRLIQSLL